MGKHPLHGFRFIIIDAIFLADKKTCMSEPELIQIIKFPFGSADIYKDKTIMTYFSDPMPLNITDLTQVPFCVKRERNKSTSSYLFRYLDSIIVKKEFDRTIYDYARARAHYSDVLPIPITYRMSIDELHASHTACSSDSSFFKLPDDFMVFADIEM